VVSFYLLFSIFFSSPNLSGRTLDVYHTSTQLNSTQLIEQLRMQVINTSMSISI